MVARLAFAAVAALLCTAALAAGRTLSEADLEAYARLRDARALADARQAGADSPARRAQVREAFQKSLQAERWTEPRYEEVDGLVADVAAHLQRAAENRGRAEASWEDAEPVDAATVARVKARLAQLDGAPERARQALRGEQEVAVLGRLATRADLQGTWQRDREASRAHLASALHMSEAQVKELVKDQGEATFTFAGDQAEGREARAGSATAWTAAYRLEGRILVLTRQGGEERLQVGVKSPTELIFGVMGVPSGVFKKR